MSEIREEWGNVPRFAYVEAFDTEGNEIVVPKCEKCQKYKNMIIGKTAFDWICMNGCKHD
jgi:hypothetical protein